MAPAVDSRAEYLRAFMDENQAMYRQAEISSPVFDTARDAFVTISLPIATGKHYITHAGLRAGYGDKRMM
jgi:hypothetical protein